MHVTSHGQTPHPRLKMAQIALNAPVPGCAAEIGAVALGASWEVQAACACAAFPTLRAMIAFCIPCTPHQGER